MNLPCGFSVDKTTRSLSHTSPKNVQERCIGPGAIAYKKWMACPFARRFYAQVILCRQVETLFQAGLPHVRTSNCYTTLPETANSVITT